METLLIYFKAAPATRQQLRRYGWRRCGQGGIMPKSFNFIGLSLLFATLTLTGLSCGKSNSTPTTSPTTTASATVQTDLTNISSSTIATSFTTNYTLAKQKAAEWKSDAQLYDLIIKLPRDLSLNNATETYVFGSPKEPNYWWIFAISESSGKYLRSLVYKTDYLGNTLNPIPEKYWQTNYLQALQAADRYQGSAFRSANSDTEVTVSLSQGEPKGWLWWTVEYKAPDGNSLKIRVHPVDLNIYDDSGNIIATGSTGVTSGTTGTVTNPTATPTITPK